jgi:hypothetical protein
VTPTTSKVVYTLFFDNSMLPDDAARAADKERRRGLYTETKTGGLSAAEALHEITKAILRAPAEGLFGIGVKLATMGEEEDLPACQDAVNSALKALDQLAGTKFADYVPNTGWFDDRRICFVQPTC